MKRAIIAISWAASLFCAYRAGHVVSNRYDYSAPAEVMSVIDKWPEDSIPGNDPMRKPRFRTFGRFVLLRSEDPRPAALQAGIFGGPSFYPVIFVNDDAKSGRPDSVLLWDAAGNSVSVLDNNRDGVFDVLGLFTTNGTYRDVGLSGKWQFRTNTAK